MSYRFPRVAHRRRYVTKDDARETYVVADDVDCNIPRRPWGSHHECGAYQWARGVLVELHRYLDAEPVALHYRELSTDPPTDPNHGYTRLPVGVEVTARLRDRGGQIVTVVTRSESAPYGPHGDYWDVRVDGVVPVHDDDAAFDGVHSYPPSLPFLALLVALHRDDLRRRHSEETTASACPSPSGAGPVG